MGLVPKIKVTVKYSTLDFEFFFCSVANDREEVLIMSRPFKKPLRGEKVQFKNFLKVL